MTIKEDGLDIAAKLAAAEDSGPTPELTELHKALRGALYRHRAVLGLSDDDVAEIDNYGPQARGGGAKDAAPQE
jgi:hypothetical protein